MLHVTIHAVERFIRRWRPGTPFAEARALLEKVAANAVATRRRTIRRDAWIDACTDVATLDTWLALAARATSASEIFTD
jgi:hypothetical protein